MLNEIDRARSALFYLDASCNRETWVRIGMSAKSAGLDVSDWIDWCATGANYCGEREACAVWRSFSPSGGVGPATLFRAAIDAGWQGGTQTATPNKDARNKIGRFTVRVGRDTLDPRWLAYWQSLGQIRDAGRQYLEARQCALPPADGALRYDSNARHPSGYVGACLVALVTDIATREPISLHRTWTHADGTKADVDPPRLLLGGHRKAGGVIRLWPDEAVTHGLAIGEGIETALSLAQAFTPVWALIDAGNLGSFEPANGIESLTIAVDDDAAGVNAAERCAAAWVLAEHSVTLVEACRHGT